MHPECAEVKGTLDLMCSVCHLGFLSLQEMRQGERGDGRIERLSEKVRFRAGAAPP